MKKLNLAFGALLLVMANIVLTGKHSHNVIFTKNVILTYTKQ